MSELKDEIAEIKRFCVLVLQTTTDAETLREANRILTKYEDALVQPDLDEAQKEKWTNHGSEMMASQIRKAIVAGIGRFLNEDANWILDRIVDIQEKGRQLLSYWQERALKVEGVNEEMFEGLRVKRECMFCFAGLKCTVCGGTGKLYRPLTMEEKSMVIDEVTRYFCSDEFDGFRLSTGVEVVRK